MSDLNELQSSLPVKIAGSTTSGLETSFVRASGNGDIGSVDIVLNGGSLGELNLLANTPIELKVSVGRLLDRKLAGLFNKSNRVIYWSYTTSGFTTDVYAGRISSNQPAEWRIGDAPIYLLCATSATINVYEAG